jgi:hypothetical protein
VKFHTLQNLYTVGRHRSRYALHYNAWLCFQQSKKQQTRFFYLVQLNLSWLSKTMNSYTSWYIIFYIFSLHICLSLLICHNIFFGSNFYFQSQMMRIQITIFTLHFGCLSRDSNPGPSNWPKNFTQVHDLA